MAIGDPFNSLTTLLREGVDSAPGSVSNDRIKAIFNQFKEEAAHTHFPVDMVLLNTIDPDSTDARAVGDVALAAFGKNRAFLMACEEGNVALMRLLLDRGYTLDGTEHTILRAAVGSGNIDAISLLIERKVLTEGLTALVRELAPSLEKDLRLRYPDVFEKLPSFKERFMDLVPSIKRIARGKGELTAAGQPWRRVDDDYLLKEIVAAEADPSLASHFCIALWQKSSSALSLQAWLREAKEAWAKAPGSLSFATWLIVRDNNDKAQKAWREEHPGAKFSENDFLRWKEEIEPITGIPAWTLRAQYRQESRGKDFATWLPDFITEQKNRFAFLVQPFGDLVPTLDDESSREISSLIYNYMTFVAPLEEDHTDMMAASMKPIAGVMKEIWKKRHGSEEGFADYFQAKARHIKKMMEGGGDSDLEAVNNITPAEIAAVKRQEEEDYKKQKELVGLADMPLDLWRLQQVRSIMGLQPFVSLNKEERRPYQAGCATGIVTRKGAPVSTERAFTRFSGTGHAIFVIGPDDQLYMANHLVDIFHHSSFFGGGVVMAAGEIKTDETGKVISLTNCSGHYKPTPKENCAMLRWFAAHGVDLSATTFQVISRGGPLEPVNAQDYLRLNS